MITYYFPKSWGWSEVFAWLSEHRVPRYKVLKCYIALNAAIEMDVLV